MANYKAPAQQSVVPFTVDDALSDVNKYKLFVDNLIDLADKVKDNSHQLRYIQEEMRKKEINDIFITVAEAAEAMHCGKKTAMKRLEERGVEILDYGKTYVVFKENFLNAFREA